MYLTWGGIPLIFPTGSSVTITLKKKPFQKILKHIRRQKIHYYIKYVESKGLLCIKEIGSSEDCFIQSAQEIYNNKKLFKHFDSTDAAYIREVALFEIKGSAV